MASELSPRTAEVEAMRQAVKKLELTAGNAEAEKAFLAATDAALAEMRQAGRCPADVPPAVAGLLPFWSKLPDAVIRDAPARFGDYLVRRVIIEYRKDRAPAIRARLDAIVATAAAGQDLADRMHTRVLALAVEDDILQYLKKQDSALRSKIMHALQSEAVRKPMSLPILWEFLTLENCRRVDEAVFAGNKNDQVDALRLLTRLLQTVLRKMLKE